MEKLIFGMIIMGIGLGLTTLGGYIAKDGWEKLIKNKQPNASSHTPPIRQIVTGNQNIQIVTNGEVNIDNRKIEQAVPRKLTSEQKKMLLAHLKPFAGKRITFSIEEPGERNEFILQIRDIFNEAGWETKLFGAALEYTTEYFLSISDKEIHSKATEAIVSAFKNININFTLTEMETDIPTDFVILIGRHPDLIK